MNLRPSSREIQHQITTAHACQIYQMHNNCGWIRTSKGFRTLCPNLMHIHVALHATLGHLMLDGLKMNAHIHSILKIIQPHVGMHMPHSGIHMQEHGTY